MSFRRRRDVINAVAHKNPNPKETFDLFNTLTAKS
jgi:hypothetical protein